MSSYGIVPIGIGCSIVLFECLSHLPFHPASEQVLWGHCSQLQYISCTNWVGNNQERHHLENSAFAKDKDLGNVECYTQLNADKSQVGC